MNNNYAAQTSLSGYPRNKIIKTQSRGMKKLMQKTKENVQERILMNLAGKFSRNLPVLVPEAFRKIGKI